jgi:excisionase family DNA binding protein
MELLTVAETAAYLKVSTVTVRRYIKTKCLPCARVGRNIRVRREDVDALPELQTEGRVFKDVYFGEGDPFWDLVRARYTSGGSDIAKYKDKYIADAIHPRE